MKKITVISLFLCFFMLELSVYAEKKLTDHEKNAKILDQIRQKYSTMYKKYLGIKTKREVEIKEYDAVTNKLASTSNLVLISRDFFYEEPDVQVLSYKKDGKQMKLSDYKMKNSKPTYPAFDENGTDYYNMKIVGYKKIGKENCYKIEVLPKKNTPRHFKGYIYCTQKNYTILLIEGTIGEIPQPLKEFKMEFNTEKINDYIGLKHGMIIMQIEIPNAKFNKRYVTKIKVIESKPILK